MKQKSRIIITLAASLMLAVLPVFGQGNGRSVDGHGWRARMQSAKIAFLTSEIDLTPEEAQVFWPVYNKMEKEKEEAMKKSRTAYWELEKAVNDEKNTKDISALLKTYLEANDASGDIDAKYIKDFQKVIPAEKVARLFLAEEHFRINQIRKLNGNTPQPLKPRPHDEIQSR